MSTVTQPAMGPMNADQRRRMRLNGVDRRANRALKALALVGGACVFFAMLLIAYQVVDGATLAFNKFGFGFVTAKTWDPTLNQFGAYPFIYGTIVTGLFSVVLATILGVAIGLFLALMAPRRVAVVIGPMVEMLAAIPSVVLGLIGIYLISPFLLSDIEPALHTVLGFIPLFGPPGTVGNSLFAASLVLTIMVVPIIAALTRDLFLTVPLELRDGAEALGSTRWEMIRGVVLPTTVSGVTAACVLGFGRAIGEAIAVSQVVGDQSLSPTNLFDGGNTMASVIALQYQGALNHLHTASLFYLATILLVFSLLVNLAARQIGRNAVRVR
jgi:phosphate transport system permease protein